MNRMTFSYLFAVLLLSASLGYASDGSPFLRIDSYEIRDGYLYTTVSTNIPTPIKVAYGATRVQKKDDDPFISTHHQSFTLTGPTTTIKLNIAKTRWSMKAPPSALPDGSYTADVSYYTRWGPDGNEKAKTFATQNLEVETEPFLISWGKPESRDSKDLLERRSWLFDKVSIGHPWDLEIFKSHLGDEYEEIEVKKDQMRGRAAYYFKKADVTIVINTFKNEVVRYNFGKDA